MESTPRALSENIATLAKWTVEPSGFEYNPPPSALRDVEHSGRYHFSLEDEKRIVEAFAVLLSLPDDQDKIGAVCVEQNVDGNGITLRFAMNSGDGDPLRKCFRSVGDHLQDAATGVHAELIRPKLLKDVINHNEERLLGRLRSNLAKKAYRGQKPPVLHRLLVAFPLVLAYSNPTAEDTKYISSQICMLEQTFSRLHGSSLETERARQYQNVIAIMEFSKNLIHTSNFKALFDAIPADTKDANADILNAVIKNFEKIVQYSDMVNYLLDMSCNYPSLFSKIEVQCQSRDYYLTGSVQAFELQSPFHGILLRMLSDPETAISTSDAMKKRFDTPAKTVVREIEQSLTTIKHVHAEIQLLLHYERNPGNSLVPRVICSCKHACFLCNMLIKKQGKFWCPSTHGKIYPKWRIPTLSQLGLAQGPLDALNDTVRLFNEAIEQIIVAALPISGPKYKHPDESCIFRLEPSGKSMTPQDASLDTISTIAPLILPGKESGEAGNATVLASSKDVERSQPPDSGVAFTPIESIEHHFDTVHETGTNRLSEDSHIHVEASLDVPRVNVADKQSSVISGPDLDASQQLHQLPQDVFELRETQQRALRGSATDIRSSSRAGASAAKVFELDALHDCVTEPTEQSVTGNYEREEVSIQTSKARPVLTSAIAEYRRHSTSLLTHGISGSQYPMGQKHSSAGSGVTQPLSYPNKPAQVSIERRTIRLRHDTPLTCDLCPGNVVRLHTRRIQVELYYDDVWRMASNFVPSLHQATVAKSNCVFQLNVDYSSQYAEPVEGVDLIDLGSNSRLLTRPGNIFSSIGMVFRSKDDTLIVKGYAKAVS